MSFSTSHAIVSATGPSTSGTTPRTASCLISGRLNASSMTRSPVAGAAVLNQILQSRSRPTVGFGNRQNRPLSHQEIVNDDAGRCRDV